MPTFLQTVRAVGGFLDRAAMHCADTGADPDDFVEARLFDDMAPFHFQIECAVHHAVWGLEAVKTGVFAPPALVGPVPFADLRAMIGKAETALAALTPDEVNGWAGKDLDLQIGPRRLAFTSETLILSFSLPNFHFHAVTAYDILRSRGVPLGKRDYEGRAAHQISMSRSSLLGPAPKDRTVAKPSIDDVRRSVNERPLLGLVRCVLDGVVGRNPVAGSLRMNFRRPPMWSCARPDCRHRRRSRR